MSKQNSDSSRQIRSFILTSSLYNIEVGDWEINNQILGITDVEFSIRQVRLHGGKQEGSKIIIIHNPNGLTITLSPTRGMSILHVTGQDIHLGWDSPVKEVVNPAYINLQSRQGAGWLEGFNEMMVRCGFEWSGHPVTDKNGKLYSLHGKAGNTPASEVTVEIEMTPPYGIRVRGLLKESTFKNADYQIMTELSYIPGTHSFRIHDTLTNHADYPHDYQIIYHSNFGKPVLEKNARFIAPVKEISPFNDYAKKGLEDWETYLGPTKDFDEMVFNIIPYSDHNGNTIAALINKDETKGVSLEFNIKQLPYLNLWKNTDTEKQGYVTGIEPGTNHAYNVMIEREQGRIRSLNAGESVSFELTYTLLTNIEAIHATRKEIRKIQNDRKTTVKKHPTAME